MKPTPLSGLQQLTMLADAANRRKYPTLPDHARTKATFSDKSANELTTAIVAWLNLQADGKGFGTRLQSTGSYRADLARFVPSKQRRGLPDVFGIVEGVAYFIEVKMRGDRLSADQRDTISKLTKAGAHVFVASDFQSFYEWFDHVPST